MFKKVLIANRGAIACRIARTLCKLGIEPVMVYTQADSSSLHVSEGNAPILIGEGPALDSYLNVDKIITAACTSGAEAIHPGYGFLAENAVFAEACGAAGIHFIGPTPEQLRAFGLKHTARALARAAGVPLLPGTELLADCAAACSAAAGIGYPVMLKSTAGGGGIGMRVCRDEGALNAAFESVQALAQRNFADGGVYLERYIEHARHLEVQIFGDGLGQVVSLGERDCSLQRRNQKVVEEAPAPNLDATTAAALAHHAVTLGKRVAYRSAGTVEYVFDATTREFYFLEVNTRLQVEHGVTELVTGVDIVEWMVLLAAQCLPPLTALTPHVRGHAMQVRIYAEDPAKNFQPSPGLLTDVSFPTGPRCDTWVTRGTEVSPFYDPMLAKILVHAVDRTQALADLEAALAMTRIAGTETNVDYLRQVLTADAFVAATHTTATLGQLAFQPKTVDVLAAGTDTTVQDYPGRVGYWAVGVPPSGPMDDYAFRIGNALLKNEPRAAGLEMTITGATLRFNVGTMACLTGAAMTATLDGVAVPWWQPFPIAAGALLKIDGLVADGARAYLMIHGGCQVPPYLDSRATFTLGRFGGHAGRALRAGDVLHIEPVASPAAYPLLPRAMIPSFTGTRELRVMYGPHGAPDFFTDHDITVFFATEWEVHYNSSRTGVRLIGPKPTWARADGGEAGLHPSNLHDNAYAIGTVDFTGDMPVILGPDGPSLGGFVCPATVIAADRWRLGQLRAGDKVRFVPVDDTTAKILELAHEAAVTTLIKLPAEWAPATLADPVRRRIESPPHPIGVTYRPAGDQYLLIEYGPQVLDITLRFRVQALLRLIEAQGYPGILDLTPGIRSLQIHYDRRLSLSFLLRELESLEPELDAKQIETVPSRIVYLPLSWDDPATRLAIERYMQSVRNDAPWCPSNLEFIRRINGLRSVDDVHAVVFAANYLVLGLGDVYLGAPVATPLDPRHRLVTTKYNPARTWTPENAVGIGGSYLCIYGMEGPGGYQFVGRTVQMWNRFRVTPEFAQPWMLRFFDQIRFFPVSAEELKQIREDFPHGRHRLRIEDTEFSLPRYQRFLEEERSGIAGFKSRQQTAFNEERQRWRVAGQDLVAEGPGLSQGAAPPTTDNRRALAAHERAVATQVHGSVWQLKVVPGQRVKAGEILAVIESMKMEIAVIAEEVGTVTELLCGPGTQVSPGQPLIVLSTP